MQRCWLDVDGVLADFVGGIHKTLGIDFNHYYWPYKKGPKGWDFHDEIGVSFEELSKLCCFEFWRDLQWMPHGRDILRVVLEFFEPEQITLLTTPMPNIESASGKMAWIEKNLPEYKQRTIVCSAPKKILAQVPHSVLIDDCQENVDQWWANEGMAVLCPAWWNKDWFFTNDPACIVSKKLKLCQALEQVHSCPVSS